MADNKSYDHLLMGAGAMKAGTTWIYDALQKHPDIHFSREKEIHYFYARHINPNVLSDRARLRRARDYLNFDPEVASRPVLQETVRWTADWLASPINDVWFNTLFKGRGQATWAAEFSNFSALLPSDAWADIHARTRKLRVLYTLRNPMDRLWSHVKFYLTLKDRTERLDTWSLDTLENHIRTDNANYLQHNDYAGAVERMRAGLPPECLHIDVFDRIATEPRSFIADVEQFLGVDPHPLSDDLINRVVNPSPPRPMPDGLADRFRDEIADQITRLTDLGVTVPPNWRQRL